MVDGDGQDDDDGIHPLLTRWRMHNKKYHAPTTLAPILLTCSSVSATWLTEEAGRASGTLEEVSFLKQSSIKCFHSNIPLKVAWQGRCLELEESLSRFREQAHRIREVLKEKVGQHLQL